MPYRIRVSPKAFERLHAEATYRGSSVEDMIEKLILTELGSTTSAWNADETNTSRASATDIACLEADPGAPAGGGDRGYGSLYD